ncbi:HD-GYP domain-containing protein [Clostridium sp. OS1-26]|uniref:HD-GYP domain-containing protein n=1 Tax=Clostridium sp. OS1-26 TaxID=3070681 RepID=UPI0027E15A9E|nr:HD-GYP domain-containing protein [Clostridium sp. OS1-26]WML34723.1 HD-GYP domain-containing protein [Clostridium sp. OS1-26]
MRKVCILVSECNLGDIIAQKIVSKYGATIAVENTIINNYIKNKLIAFEIECIWVYGNSEKETPKVMDATFLKLKKDYKQNVIEINGLINDLSRGEKANVQRINKISDSIYNSINDEYYIVKCLSELRTADQYLYNHSVNVSFYGMLLGKWLCLTKNEINEVVQAGLLHDIGQIKVSTEILNKRGKLNLQEFEVIKKHPIYGYNMIKDLSVISDDVKEVILTHHERMNKSGYPVGKDGDELSIYSKIIAVADVYDAIISERVYRKRETPFKAFEMLQNDSIGYFDIHIINTFLGNLAACYVGSKVLLNNGCTGEILYVPPHAISKPIVSVNSEYIDLSKKSNLEITTML